MPTAQRAKVGIPTGEMSEAGKPLYKTAEGETVSEKSITVPFGDKWVNVPSIQDGVRYEDDEIEDMLAAGEIKPTSTHSTMEEAVSAAQERSSGLIKPKMAKGGQVKSQTKRLLAEGGLKHQGGTKDPVSGNNVPVGATQEEVRDDIPAQLSEGEFVFPADVVRFIGLERLMMMRQAAKQGLMKMEDMGQMSNGDEGSEEEDTSDFESQIDEIMDGMESEEPREMAEGGMPMPAEQPAPAEQPMIAQTNAALGNAQPAPAQGPSERDIITESMKNDSFTPEEKTAVSTFLTSEASKSALTLRNNNTIFVVLGSQPGVVSAQTFSIDPPEVLTDSVAKFVDSLKQANINTLRGETKNPSLLQAYEAQGLTPESQEENGIISYTVAIPKAEGQPAIPAAQPVAPPPPQPQPPTAAAPQTPNPMV